MTMDIIMDKINESILYILYEIGVKPSDFIEVYKKNNDDISKTINFFIQNYNFTNQKFNLNDLKDKKIKYCGVDVSRKLIEIAKEKYQTEDTDFQKISSSSILPFPENFFNKIFSISVFHHFPQNYAKKMARELYRITKPKGIIIISVWNLWQKRYLKYLLCPKCILKKIFQISEYKNFSFKDIIIPFKNNQGEIFNRYHRVFTKRDLKKIFEKAGFKIEKIFVLNKKNIVLIGKKQ